MTDFAQLVYLLCLATSVVCMVLLVRGYLRSRSKLLLWSALCFVGLALNNLLLFIDVVVFPVEVSLVGYRTAALFGAIAVLLFGFVWETE